MKNKIGFVFPLIAALLVVIVSLWKPGFTVEVSVGLFIVIALYSLFKKDDR